MQVKREEIATVARMVDELCGVVLDETKGYLIESRLGNIAQEAGCADFTSLCRLARTNATLKLKIIDAITTQETLFFRDNSPFQALQHRVVPDVIDVKAKTAFPKRLRIWSAACSTGQEPYSIAMTLAELLPDIRSWDINILATDISDAAIMHASLGRYAPHEMQRGMKQHLLNKYFQQETGGWRVKEQLRFMIRFDRRNLLQPFSGLGPFDIIFCRNVAIYFDADVRRDLFHRLSDRLTPDGYLFTGSSESLNSLDPRFVAQHHCGGIYYQPNTRSVVAVA